MIVKYSRDRNFEGLGKDPHLTIGKSYLVFGIVFRFDSINYPPQVIVQSDVDQLPGLWSLHHFDVVDERIPGNWAFNEFKYFGVVENYYQICPHEFLGEFWNLFNDANKDAESIFFAVKELIRRFHDFGG